MKTLKFVFIIFILIFSGYKSTVSAQLVELSVDSNVYVYDTIKHTIENKSTYLKKFPTKPCDYVGITNNDFSSIYKKAFSLERIKELAQEKRSVGILLYADSSGIIVKTIFLLRNATIPIITLSEIKALEEAIRDYRLELRTKCDEVEYYMFLARCRFNQL